MPPAQVAGSWAPIASSACPSSKAARQPAAGPPLHHLHAPAARQPGSLKELEEQTGRHKEIKIVIACGHHCSNCGGERAPAALLSQQLGNDEPIQWQQ